MVVHKVRFLFGVIVACAMVGGGVLEVGHAQAPVTPPGPPLVIEPVVPPVPAPTPITPAVIPTPDDLTPVFAIKATIAGEVQAGEIVELPVGRLLVLTVEGLPSEGKPAISWALNHKSVDVSVREGGWYVTFTAPVEGNWLFTAAVNNPDVAGPPLLAQRWVKVGHGPQPPPVVVPDPPGPTPVPPTPPTVEGKRSLVIVSESSKDNAAFSRLLVNLRDGSAATYLKSKGHSFTWLDADQLTPSDPWRSQFTAAELPVAFIIDAATNTVLTKEPVSSTTTADNLIEAVKRQGG